MTVFDIIIALGIIIGFILGFKDGFVRKIIGIIGFCCGVYLALTFADDIGKFLEYSLGIEFYLAEIMGGVIIFLFTILIFTILKRIVHPFDKVNSLINQIIGGAVGSIQVIFFLSAVLLLLNVFEIPDKKTADSSILYHTTYEVIPSTIDYLSGYTPKTKKIIKDYINEKDSLE
ncbi:MAG: CvpA family protein [Ignavibacteriales bacterium]|nr:CvpA family protein [Ignavibacteriales bacterium]